MIVNSIKRKIRLRRIKYWRRFLHKCMNATKSDFIYMEIEKHFSMNNKEITITETFGAVYIQLEIEGKSYFANEFWEIDSLRLIDKQIYIDMITA